VLGLPARQPRRSRQCEHLVLALRLADSEGFGMSAREGLHVGVPRGELVANRIASVRVGSSA
jgi:hypothetical protein